MVSGHHPPGMSSGIAAVATDLAVYLSLKEHDITQPRMNQMIFVLSLNLFSILRTFFRANHLSKCGFNFMLSYVTQVCFSQTWTQDFEQVNSLAMLSFSRTPQKQMKSSVSGHRGYKWKESGILHSTRSGVTLSSSGKTKSPGLFVGIQWLNKTSSHGDTHTSQLQTTSKVVMRSHHHILLP